MTKKYLTGGKIADGPTGKKGCSCKGSTGEDSAYPIRPYNDFNYCPNEFTCEKTCNGTASPPPTPPTNSNFQVGNNSTTFDYVAYTANGGQEYYKQTGKKTW